ncbi:hypothetical protein [Helicobacter rodentium]|uniref:hypothetical protein n=1 Tax=Helicobacter rodentium TaxID=59617 RepID=UPI0023F34847|nr:hypothetical protein [Helicobacter rodentium]
MKILSLENHKNGGKNILIPCFLYEVVVDETYRGNNILEEVVAKIIDIEPHYKNDIDRLAEILGLKDSNDIEPLLKLVLSKIENPQTQEVRKEIKQYQIYQERISGEVLGIITQNIDRFIEPSGGNKDKNEIKFERYGELLTTTIVPSNKNIITPAIRQIFKAITMHNRNGDSKISENLDLKVPKHREPILLHCQVVLGENRKFRVTNGFNSAFSLQLENVLRDHCIDLLKTLRGNNYTDEKKESAYRQIYGDLRDEVAYNLQRFDSIEKNKNKHLYLYNAYEQYFTYLVRRNNYSIPTYLNKAESIRENAEQMGFKVDKVGLFSNDEKDNLKSHLARLLHNDDKVLNKFAENNANFLELLSTLHKDRNVALHGGEKEKNHREMDIKELNILKELLESISSINIKKGEEMNSNNGIVLLEKELPDIINTLSDESIEALSKVRVSLEEIRKESILSLDTFGDMTQGLYKVCESVLLKYIQTHKARVKEADIEQIRKMSWLDKVGDHYVENAKNGQNASLGAYIIIYLSINKDEDLSSIKRLLELRAHGNPTIADLQKTSIDELKDLYDNIIDFIAKVVNQT